jgi:hypothetical protein
VDVRSIQAAIHGMDPSIYTSMPIDRYINPGQSIGAVAQWSEQGTHKTF